MDLFDPAGTYGWRAGEFSFVFDELSFVLIFIRASIARCFALIVVRHGIWSGLSEFCSQHALLRPPNMQRYADFWP